MKKFTKITLITAAVLAVLGIVLLGAGLVSGGSISVFEDYETEQLERYIGRWRHNTKEHISEVTGVSEVSESDAGFGMKSIEAEKVENLKVEVLQGKVQIEAVKGHEIRISGLRASDKVIYDEEEREFSISCDMQEDYGEEALLIEIPAEKQFKEVDLYAITGELMVSDRLRADEIWMRAEAGNLEANLLDCLESELACESGNLNVKFVGELEDYEVEIESDNGTILVNEKNYSGFRDRTLGREGSRKSIEAECDRGNLEIQFENKS